MFVRNELRQLHEGSEQTGDTIDWNGDGSDEDAVHAVVDHPGRVKQFNIIIITDA